MSEPKSFQFSKWLLPFHPRKLLLHFGKNGQSCSERESVQNLPKSIKLRTEFGHSLRHSVCISQPRASAPSLHVSNFRIRRRHLTFKRMDCFGILPFMRPTQYPLQPSRLFFCNALSSTFPNVIRIRHSGRQWNNTIRDGYNYYRMSKNVKKITSCGSTNDFVFRFIRVTNIV